jgi:hypothetical protein
VTAQSECSFSRVFLGQDLSFFRVRVVQGR